MGRRLELGIPAMEQSPLVGTLLTLGQAVARDLEAGPAALMVGLYLVVYCGVSTGTGPGRGEAAFPFRLPPSAFSLPA